MGSCETGQLPGQLLRLLLVDDEADTLLPVLAQGLEPFGFSVDKESDPANALSTVADCAPGAILLDLHFPGDDETGEPGTTGGRLLAEVRRRFGSVPVLVFTTRLDDVDIPLEAFEERPHGYFAKPEFDKDEGWAERLSQAIRDTTAAARHEEVAETDDLDFLVGQTREMREAVTAIRTAAGNRLTAPIYGETGTGKVLAAEAVHRLSGRTGTFRRYTCSDADSGIAETALFGGSHATGLLEQADGGTLFLKQVQELSIDLQERVMSAVESGTLERTGIAPDRAIDVRLIVATNHSLSDLVADGVLHEGLAYHLAQGLPISLPPLRHRLEDLPGFFAIFIERANEWTGRQVSIVLRPETLAELEAHTWPGNIRELKSALTRAVATTTSNVLLPDDIKFAIAAGREARPVGKAHAGADTSGAAISPAVDALVDELESLPINERYEFLKSQGDGLRREIVADFVRRLREKTGKRIQHKVLAAELDSLEDPERDLNRIRQLLHSCGIRLTQLEVNQ